MTTVEDAAAIVTAPEHRVRILERPRATTGKFSWVTTVDHKKIAIMYATLALFFFLRRRYRGAVHPAAARAAERHDPQRGALQRVLHDARHHDGVPARHAASRPRSVTISFH